MKCVIPGINLKVFGRAIHSLAKIGDELYLEPLEQGLSLRTVNSSRSAYACFLFFPSCFQHYDDGRRQTEGSATEDEDEGLRCKIIMKSVMAIFRSLSTIEKTVEKCRITHNAKEARLVFELHCRHGIVKKHNLAYIECETLQAIFSKDLCPNKLTTPAKLLCEVVVNFQTTQEEVTLTVRPDLLSLKNYVEDEPDPNKVVHTELSLAPEEFTLYQVGLDTDITFCLKELRAILAFGETTGLPLNINFEAAGRPVTFCIDSDQTFEANFVLATLAEAEQTTSQMLSSQRGQQAVPHGPQRHPASAARGRQEGGGEVSGKSGPSKGPASSRPTVQEDNHVGDISTEDLAAAMEVEQEWEKIDRDRSRQSSSIKPGPPPQAQDTDRQTPFYSDTTAQDRPSHHRGKKKDRPSHGHDRGREGVKPVGNLDRGSHSDRGKFGGGERERGQTSGRGLVQSGPCEAGVSSWVKRGREGGGEGWVAGHRGRMMEEEEEKEEGTSSSPVIPVQCTIADGSREGPCLQTLSDDDDQDDLDETVPGTPPSTPPAKKFRSLFFGSSQKRSQPAPKTTVLAADTDEDD